VLEGHSEHSSGWTERRTVEIQTMTYKR